MLKKSDCSLCTACITLRSSTGIANAWLNHANRSVKAGCSYIDVKDDHKEVEECKWQKSS